MTAQDNAALIQSVVDAYNAKDMDQFAAAATDDCELLDPLTGKKYHGPEGFRQFLQEHMTAFPDTKIEVTNLQATDDQVLLEFVAQGTHNGPINSATGQIPATGQTAKIHLCNVYHMKDGKIAKQYSYYDRLHFNEQLGLVPQQGQGVVPPPINPHAHT